MLLRRFAFLFLIFVSYVQAKEQITSIYPNLHNGSGTVHVFILANEDVVDVFAGEWDNIVNASTIGYPASSPSDWQLGEHVEHITIKRRVWVHKFENFGTWEEQNTPVLVNCDRNNSYLKISRYADSPTKHWQQSKLQEIGTGFIRTKTGGLMIPHSNLQLTHWKVGDQIRHKQENGFIYGINWVLYNERLKEYAHPFLSISDSPSSPACYRVLSLRTESDYTYLQLDNQLHLKVPVRKMWNIFNSPLFNVGDYAIVQAKDFGIVLVHPKTKEEVYARSYDGVPGLTGLSIRESDATVTMINHPYRWHVNNPKDINELKSWNIYNTVVLALNKDAEGYVLLNGHEFWHNGHIYGPFEHDRYTQVPISHPVPTTDTYPHAHEGALPRGYQY